MAFDSGVMPEDEICCDLSTTRVKERRYNALIIINVLACSMWLEKYMQGS